MQSIELMTPEEQPKSEPEKNLLQLITAISAQITQLQELIVSQSATEPEPEPEPEPEDEPTPEPEE